MRILMLGWEFPPFIAGGLGVACQGLTRALDCAGHEVTFVLPRPIGAGATHAAGVRVMAPGEVGRGTAPAVGAVEPSPPSQSGAVTPAASVQRLHFPGYRHATFEGVAADFSSPYPQFSALDAARWESGRRADRGADLGAEAHAQMQFAQESAAARREILGGEHETVVAPAPLPFAHYGTDLVGDAERYAHLVVGLARDAEMDVVHAHDWLTFPAAIALSGLRRVPLVVHVHSTEFDRAGASINQRVYEIERAGMQAADRVIAVSNFTKSIVVRRYGVPEGKIDVAYNGIEREAAQPAPGAAIRADDRIVLFLGRITMQKGPEYFIAAAQRVLEKMENVRFVLAGSGDMALRMMELAGNLGIGDKVLFTGFLKGTDVERIFSLADCYVMPSVSEPFGLAALEAIRQEVPVIISKTSGASEVLRHVLKVDFWDINDIADKILAVLRYPPLGRTLREEGTFEIQRLTWEGTAQACERSYLAALNARAAVRLAR